MYPMRSTVSGDITLYIMLLCPAAIGHSTHIYSSKEFSTSSSPAEGGRRLDVSDITLPFSGTGSQGDIGHRQRGGHTRAAFPQRSGRHYNRGTGRRGGEGR